MTEPSNTPGPQFQPRTEATTPVGPTPKARELLRVGIPRVLNLWSTHQFWIGFLEALGIETRRIEFSSDTSEDQARTYAKGRGTVDCCYPVKCMSGHYGELLARSKRKIDILFSPMIHSVPSFLGGHVTDSLTCPRVMAGPENIKAGFLKERDAFAEAGVRYVSPFVSLADPPVVPKQLFAGFKDAIPGLTIEETARAVQAGYAALDAYNRRLRAKGREILEWCAREGRPCILVLARPYHMDPGIGHEIEVDLQAHGYPVLWAQYLPTDDDLTHWMFGPDIAAGHIRSPFDINDVWPSSYSANTNEILWGAKFAARMPWIACVVRLASYECGMDQPTYSPVQAIVERSGTLFFSFQDLDSTKPAGSVKIRVETVAHYLGKLGPGIIERKRAASPAHCPLEAAATAPAVSATAD
ncbi:MAG TPA: acyl-CoA dehydratase activase-related protein [Steroidobacteraceae bacterium]|nr:acyl-CoA dehydratase activase-related protein [Steroidobacteraceae bacterium]